MKNSKKLRALAMATAAVVPPAFANPDPLIVYGVGQGTLGKSFYKVDLDANTSSVFRSLAQDPSLTDANSPNGVGYDEQNDLLYYSVNDGKTNDRLFSIPAAASAEAPKARGRLRGRVYNGTFYLGDYYYIPNRTADLWRADIDPATGQILGNTPVCAGFRAAGSDLRFGDIAALDGWVYGGARDGANSQILLFKVKLDDCTYQELPQTESRSLQLTFATDGVLYGYNLALANFRIVNKSDGSTSAGPTYAPPANLADIASPAPAPKVELVKKTNGADGAGGDILIGETVTWTYEVTNAGQVPLTDITVTDDKVASADIICDDTDDADNVIDSLAVGATATCEASGVAVEGPYTNTGTAEVTFDGRTVNDTDSDGYNGTHPAALLAIDEDSLGLYEKVSKTGGTVNYLSSSWTSSNLGSSASGKRSILPYFAANVGKTITVVTGKVGGGSSGDDDDDNYSSSYDSGEGWFAPNCIPQTWIGGASAIYPYLIGSPPTGTSCLTGDDRTAGIRNFLFNGTTPYTGAPASTAISSTELHNVRDVMPLRARGLKLLEGSKVCAVVYKGDIDIDYNSGYNNDYNNDYNGGYNTSTYNSSEPYIDADLDGSTYGIVAFKVKEARTRSCSGSSSYCLPEMQIEILDPASTCNEVVLYNAPVPNGETYPRDTLVSPLYTNIGTYKYRRLKFDELSDLLY